jgi:ubiquinone/menaquinone biosynthesis C-methylase UbiE
VTRRALSEVGRKFARFATNVAVRSPRLWWFFRPLIRKQFDAIATQWDTMRDPDHLAPYEAALQAVDGAPARALDLGTGTGQGAFAIAQLFPEAEVVGADLSERMLAEARGKTPPELANRIRFERGDASALPYADGSFQLVAHANMIPFFDELARVLSPGGHALFAFSGGAETPIYVPHERLREELSRRGFVEFADFTAGHGTALLARKGDRT